MIAITIRDRRVRNTRNNHVIRITEGSPVEKGKYLRVGRAITAASTFPEKLGNCSQRALRLGTRERSTMYTRRSNLLHVSCNAYRSHIIARYISRKRISFFS